VQRRGGGYARVHPHAHTTTQTTARFINCARTARSSGWQWAAVIVASPSPHTSPHHQPPHSTPALAPMPACTYCLVKSGWPVPTYLFCKCSQLRLMLNRSAAYRLVDGGGGGGEWLHNDDGVAGLLRWKGREGRLEGAYHFDENCWKLALAAAAAACVCL